MKNLALTLLTVLFFAGTLIAQDDSETTHNVSIEIPTISILDVEDADGEAQSINLSPDISALEAGEAIDFSDATDASLWLNYTSVVTDGNTNKVTAAINSGNLPSGVSLKLSVGSASTGGGETGEAVSGSIELESGAKDIVTQIGSAYTGTGANNGHQLTYSLEMDNDDFEDLVANTYTVEILYTITDN